MMTLREPADTARVEDAAIRALVIRRFDELRSPDYTWAELGYFVIVEPDDIITELETAHHIAITTGYCCTVNYGQSGFIPSFELIEEHESSYELVFILNDSGFGVTLFVPKLPVTELVRFCREFTLAQPATSSRSVQPE
jgi:hypothetical protein